MSQIVVKPLFESCCSGAASASVSTSNPNCYYDITVNAAPPVPPPNPALRATCFEQNGNGATYIWNPSTATWNRN